MWASCHEDMREIAAGHAEGYAGGSVTASPLREGIFIIPLPPTLITLQHRARPLTVMILFIPTAMIAAAKDLIWPRMEEQEEEEGNRGARKNHDGAISPCDTLTIGC